MSRMAFRSLNSSINSNTRINEKNILRHLVKLVQHIRRIIQDDQPFFSTNPTIPTHSAMRIIIKMPKCSHEANLYSRSSIFFILSTVHDAKFQLQEEYSLNIIMSNLDNRDNHNYHFGR